MPHLPPGAWRPAYTAVRRLASPIRNFLQLDVASGLVLAAATAAALVWASSPWAGSYQALWHTELSVGLGALRFARPLAFWVNDGLMTVFFFGVGLEIRHELHAGELRDLRRAALPIVAAIGGMLVPAVIYAACNAGHAGARGWGIPMATDIAFAVGALTLLGARVHPSLRVVLLSLAVIDDIGAIVVIAVFYAAGLDPIGGLIAAAGIAAVIAMKASGVRGALGYVVPGLVVWAGMYASGIHPTLAGVVLGLLTPVRGWVPAGDEPAPEPPVIALSRLLQPWISFVIMPLFALANAGVALGGASLTGDGVAVFLGVVLGLVLGKPAGVLLASQLAVRGRIATRPDGMPRHGGVVIGVLAGIGFTMSLFIAQLALPPGPLLETAKLAILVGSAVSGVLGLALGAWLLRPVARADR